MAYHTIDKNINNNSNGNSNNSGNSTGTGSGSSPIQIANAKNVISDAPDLLIDYEKKAKKKQISKVLFRDSVIEKMLTILQTNKHPNPLMLGDAGTGKTSIVEHLAVLLYEQNPLVIAMIDPKTKIYELPLVNLIAGSGVFGELESKLNEVIDFISNPKNKAILYIDELHQLQTNHALKSVAEILKPALARGDMHLIGATTTQELKHLRENNALMRRFSKVNIDELSNEQTFEVLKMILPSLQKNKIHVNVHDDLLHYAIQVGNDNSKMLESSRPDTSITILDQALSYARLQSIKVQQSSNVTIAPTLSKHVVDASMKQLINSDNVKLNEQTVLKLKDIFQKSIVGQDKAKEEVTHVTKTIVRNLRKRTKPHSFLFAGPTGVGKSEIAKCLAKTLFDSHEAFIYMNMTEYAHDSSLTSIIGSSRGYIGSESSQPLPLDSLKSKPFQILLLDEFEKAGTAVKQIFMQALDEGFIQYADNSYVDFSKAIIIATTNAGVEEMNAQSIGFNSNSEPTEKDITKTLMNDFPVELLNRLEHKIQFTNLSKNEYNEILVIKYNKIIAEIEELNPELDLQPKIANTSMDFIQKLSDNSYDSLLNGRPAERTVDEHIQRIILNNPGQSKIQLDII